MAAYSFCAAKFDCNTDVIHILGGLVQAGLAKSKQTVFHEGEFERIAESRVEYSLI
ncbi:hypothetical protein TUM3794_20420 [Shewanella colwelliana]|uniref:Uncharacterized protein n=1 Tax=Shewanella colwelliana TaxID=23 RepID=A0ABQ4P0I1_SHECO|nr:hypothetical protein TUM3794_20420 [Shewanella colwelliana]